MAAGRHDMEAPTAGAGLPRSASAATLASKSAKASQAAEAGSSRSLAAWRETWRQLGLQAWAAESDTRRELLAAQGSAKSLFRPDQAEELRSTWATSEQTRQAWEQELWSGLGRLRKRVSALGSNMRFAPSRKDVHGLVTTAEHELQVFAEQARQQFDDLAGQEYGLEDSLQASLARFEGWCSQESAMKRPSSEAASSSSGLPRRSLAKATSKDSIGRASGLNERSADSDVAAIRDRLEQIAAEIGREGGATGGWPGDDHEAFMRLLTSKFRRKASSEFVSEAECLLPHYSHEALVAHAKWFADSERLQ
ncbi:unnamed protein product, partial [Polarella glacialis]